jgi:hypothetical protein
LAAVRRRIDKAQHRKRRRPHATDPKRATAQPTKPASRTGVDRVEAKPAGGVVKKSGKKARQKRAMKKVKLPPKWCTKCGSEFRPTTGRQQRCSVCSPRPSSSVRTVSGGLPGLGKRR